MTPIGPSQSVRIKTDVAACGQCGCASRVGRGLCLNCLLQRGLDTKTGGSETLEEVLDSVDVRDADWRIGNYQILEEIGRGGMGVIYRARQRHSRRIVALKRILSYHADSRETLARFRREAEAAASLDHPNILPIYEVSESTDGLPFFSMKFAPGGSLFDARERLRGHGREIVRLMAKITRAVQYAHGQGILHRDLKPGNILLDGRDEPMVSDFGLAKWLDANTDLTRTLTIFGTPGYIAPEQAHGPAKDLTPAADVYSLGAILFDLLAGRPPFLGEHALAVVKQAADKPAPKLRSLVPNAGRDLETICARCLERDPTARYRSAHDLANDFELYLQGRPILARPVGIPARAIRWTKRNPVMAGMVLIAFALASIAVVRQVQNAQLTQATIANQHSIAVLPFLNLDSATMDAKIAEETKQGLDSELRRLGPARVVLATGEWSSATGEPGEETKQAADKLGTRTLLTGTQRVINGARHITVRLLDPSGHQLARGMFDIPSPTAASLVTPDFAQQTYHILNQSDWTDLLRAQEDPVFRNPKAREMFLVARELIGRQNISEIDHGLDCLRKAISAEPRSALAHAYFARLATMRVHYQTNAKLWAEARTAANEALRLAPESGEAHRAMSGVYFLDGRSREAADEVLHEMELDGPTTHSAAVVGDHLKLIGRPDRALAWFAIMSRWQHRPADDGWIIGDCWSDLGEDSRAEEIYHRASELHPEQPTGWIGLCRLRMLNRKFDEARAIFQENEKGFDAFSYVQQIGAQLEFFARNFPEAEKRYRDLAEKDPDGGGAFYGAVSYRSAWARCLMESNRPAGENILKEEREKEMKALAIAPNHPEILYRLAAIESGLGATDESMAHLKAALENGWIDHRSLELDPRFDRARKNASYNQLREAMEQKVKALRRSMPAAENWQSSN